MFSVFMFRSSHFTKYIFSNIQEIFHKVNNIMKEQAAIRIIKHTKNHINKISCLPRYIETRKQRNKNV